jgi:hypothetical protein
MDLIKQSRIMSIYKVQLFAFKEEKLLHLTFNFIILGNEMRLGDPVTYASNLEHVCFCNKISIFFEAKLKIKLELKTQNSKAEFETCHRMLAGRRRRSWSICILC